MPLTPPAAQPSFLRYKVVESSTVTDESLEAIINDHVAQGWTFEGMQFAMRESSKRPAMVFVLFTRQEAAPAGKDDRSGAAASERGPLGGEEDGQR